MRMSYMILAGLVFAGAPCSAMAATSSEGGFNISLYIPVVCDLDTTEFQFDSSQNEIVGQVHEYCNSSRGFQVVASHRPLEASESVEVGYGDQHSLLEQGGISMVAFRSGPRLSTVPVRIRASGLVSQLSVAFAVTAI